MAPASLSLRLLLLMGLFASAAPAAETATPETFIYQRDVGAADDRNQYEVRVLRAALEHTRASWGGYEVQAMEQDGSLESLFKAEFGSAIDRLGLDRRQVIELPNPLLDGKDPLDDPALWYRPR